MKPDQDLLDVRDARRWRTWLVENHASSTGIWLVFHKRHTGVPAVPYEEAVRHALCFGWIDSLVKRIDDRRYALKFTPRKRESKWSDTNRKRWAELKKNGELQPAGLTAAPTSNRYAAKPRIPLLPAYIADAFRVNSRAWTFFESLPAREKRNFVVWIHMAKRDATRARRIAESIKLLASGKKLGLK